MARVKGKFTIDTNYDISVRKPFDARTLVPSYADLTNRDNWTIDNKIIAFNGLVVSVADAADTTKNGMYFLFDPNCTTTIKSPDVTKEENWHKLSENSDINKILEELQLIDTTLNGSDGLAVKVEDSITAIDEIKSSYVKAEDLTPYAKTEDVVLSASFIEFKDATDAAILEIVNTANSKADLVALNDYYKIADADKKFATQENTNKIAEIANANSAKLEGITTTVLSVIEDAVKNVKVEAATQEMIGGIKSASGDNKVSVDANGIASVDTININSLVQNKGDILILDNGDSLDDQE